MRRGTTPTVTLHLNGISVDTLDSIYITFKQGTKILTKNTGIFVDEDENTLEVSLTQEDTLAFSAQPVAIQVRAMVGVKAIATEIKSVNMEDVLQGGVIS